MHDVAHRPMQVASELRAMQESMLTDFQIAAAAVTKLQAKLKLEKRRGEKSEKTAGASTTALHEQVAEAVSDRDRAVQEARAAAQRAAAAELAASRRVLEADESMEEAKAQLEGVRRFLYILFCSAHPHLAPRLASIRLQLHLHPIQPLWLTHATAGREGE